MQTNKVLASPELVKKLSDAILMIDSTALIDASKSDVFLDFMVQLANSECTLATIPSVLYEVKRGVHNLVQLASLNNMLKGLEMEIIPQLEKKAQEDTNQIFTMLYNKEAFGGRKEKGPSYTDALLCLTLYLFRHTNIKLLTTNYKDIPLGLFDREELMVYDTGNEVRTAAIYSLSEEKLSGKLNMLK